jgi:hypothetical protein
MLPKIIAGTQLIQFSSDSAKAKPSNPFQDQQHYYSRARCDPFEFPEAGPDRKRLFESAGEWSSRW